MIDRFRRPAWAPIPGSAIPDRGTRQDGCFPRYAPDVRHRAHPRHDVHGQEPVPPRSGRRQLRRARDLQAGDAQGHRGEPHALPAHARPAAPAPAHRREAADQERHPGRERRRHHRQQRRHPRHLLRAARGARTGRRGDLPRSAVAAVTRHHAFGARRAGAGAGTRGTGLPLGSRRAREGHHAEDQGHLHQLAHQPERRRADPRRPRAHRRDGEGAQPVGVLGRSLRRRALQRRTREHRVAAGHVRAHDPDLHDEQDLRGDRRARGLHRHQGQGDARPRRQGGPLHGQQRLLDRAVRRHRRAGRPAGLHRGVQDGTEDPPRPFLRRPEGRHEGRAVG